MTPPEPMPPSAPGQDCCVDLLEPLPTGECILVIIDYFSRFVDVAILKTTTRTKLIETISPMFARFGVPISLLFSFFVCMVLNIVGLRHYGHKLTARGNAKIVRCIIFAD